MSETGYKLLGFVVWRGGRWYLRRRAPSARLIAGVGLGALSAAAGAALILRRAGDSA